MQVRNYAAGPLAALLVILTVGPAAPAGAQDDLRPTARVAYPNLSTSGAVVAPPTVTVGLTGTDPDTPGGRPVRVRYLLKEAVTADGGVIRTPNDYNLHYEELVSFDDPDWSSWLDLGVAGQDPTVTFIGLVDGTYYLLAVQTLDSDGAVSLGRGYQVSVGHFLIREGFLRPFVTLAETYLGTSTSSYQAFEIAAGQPLNFSWAASAATYNGTIVSVRYGWDLVDVNDPYDPGWTVPPGLHERAGERIFSGGLHSFHLRVVDNVGQVALLERQLLVIPFVDPQYQRPLLVIDQVIDERMQSWPDYQGRPRNDEVYRNAYWHFLAEGSGGVAGFDWERDRFDHRDQVRYADLVGYRAVLCYAQINTRQLMFDQFRAVNDQDRYVWLAPYQQGGGNLFLVGGGSMDSFLEVLPNYMTPTVFDTQEQSWSTGETTFVVGFGPKVLPDGSEVARGVTMYPYAIAGISALDWTSVNTKYVYARPGGAMNFQRGVDCVGLKGLVLDPAFRDHWAPAPGAIADTIRTDQVIDWQDAYYDQNGTLDVVHSTFPFRNDEFVNANISPRTTPFDEQQCDDTNAPGGLCIEPMFRGIARFDWLREHKRQQGDPGWPEGTYTTAELDGMCGVMALTAYEDLPRGSARTNGQTYGYLSYKTTADKPGGRPDVYWGFDPYRFDHAQGKRAIRWVLDMFGVQLNP